MIDCKSLAEALEIADRLRIEAPSQSRPAWRVFQAGDALPEHCKSDEERGTAVAETSLEELFTAKCISDLAWRLGKAPDALSAAEIRAERERIAAICKAL